MSAGDPLAANTKQSTDEELARQIQVSFNPTEQLYQYTSILFPFNSRQEDFGSSMIDMLVCFLVAQEP